MGIPENFWKEYIQENDMDDGIKPLSGEITANTCELFPVIYGLDGSYNAIKLLFLLINTTDKDNQVRDNRQELSEAMGIKYNKGNFGLLLRKLIDNECVAMFGKTIVVNPYLFYHTSSTSKKRRVLELAWDNNVTYSDNNVWTNK